MNRVDNANFNETQAEILFDEINAAFLDLDIIFYWDCIVYDTDHTLNSRNAIDINISPGSTGDTPQMPGTEVEIGDSRDNAVVIHELGHALGLLHTHNSDNHFNTNPGSETCEEWVNPLVGEENNGYTCGDCIKSTLATTDLPRMQISYDSVNNTCTYTPKVGNNGEVVFQARDSRMDVYNPIIGNFMSYDISYNGDNSTINDIDCRSTFVAEQGNRMRNIIENSEFLGEIRIYDNFNDIDFEKFTFSEGINFGSDIIIDQELILPNGAEIAMFGNHKIVITQQGSIKGNDLLIHSACDEEWKGIEVYGQTNQNITTGVHLTGNSIIKNAKTAISQVYGGANGYMNLVGTTFQDCKRGIELMKSDNDQSIINTCNFINGTYGITAWENDFTATSCTFTNIYERGIYGIASSPNINNDNNVQGPHFKDCNIGILLAFPSGQTSPTSITDNFFLSNGTGIIIESGAGASSSALTRVQKNRFQENFVGFNASGANFYELSNNDFYDLLFGNLIEAAGSDQNQIFLNDYRGAFAGQVFGVDNSFTYVAQNCFDDHFHSDIFVDGIFTNQGTDDNANGNCFSTTNPEILTSEEGPGFDYYQLKLSNPNADECTFVESTGNFSVEDSDDSDLSDGCGYTTFAGTNIPASGHSPCNPNKNETYVSQAISDINSLIDEIENNTFLDQETKDNLIEYYERCLRKNKLLLVDILLSEGRTNEAVEILRTEEGFDMQIKGYSILLDQERLIDANNYLNNLTATTQEELDFVFAQNLYINAIINSNDSPSEVELGQLFDNAHKNTVLAGFSRSIYLYFTDELIVLPFEIDGHEYIDPRSSEKVKIEANIYPNPFSGNEFTVSRISKALDKYEVYTSEGILLSEGELNLLEQRINVNSNYIGLLILKITGIDGSIQIHKIVKAN